MTSRLLPLRSKSLGLVSQEVRIPADRNAAKADTRFGEVVGTITDGRFDIPTTVAGFGDALYVVNARFTTPPTPSTPYTVVRVAARP